MINSIKALVPILVLSGTLLITGLAIAQNKVVVIPLGDNDISGYELVSNSDSIVYQGGTGGFISVSCSAGKQVLGGGASSDTYDLHLVSSQPNNNGWFASFHNPTIQNLLVEIRVFAICAKVH